MSSLSRRSFVAGAVLAAAVRPARGLARAAVTPRTRLIVLASGGGPRPRKERGSTAHAVIVDGVLYVVDCGNGVARQLATAGVPLTALRHVLVTHHHSDHNADYGNLLLLAWASGLRTPVDTWGPPPLAKMTRLFFEMNAVDIDIRIADEGRIPLAPLITVHELTGIGPVMQDERVKISATLVDHPPVIPAFAFRFDTPDRSIVFSGDTNRSDNLVRLARGADVLVHEALYVPAVDRLVARVPNAATLKKHIIDSHTSIEDVGRVAAAAGVKTLVISHLVPADDPAVTDRMWIDAARAHFAGEIVVARDGMEL
ncbi:MAG TPA: MBL fold metallo-hydrolase [Methylomirabilota bacterium]|nr:MBL fold metallo-hydrolase [Methylomirabilota bacterium]